MTYVDPTTGEDFPEWREGLIEVDLTEPPEHEPDDYAWLGDYYTRELTKANAERAALEAQHARLVAELDAREKALEWKWGPRLQEVTRARIAAKKGKAKSVNFRYGPCGWRKSKRIEVRDEAAALAWAREHAPTAVKVTEALLKSELPEGQDVPGVERVTEDRFFARGGKA